MEDLPVRAIGRGSAIGVEDYSPAPAVDADIVVELAEQNARVDAGLSAVLLVPQVVHVAVHGGSAAPRPGAAPVAEQDGAADVGRDALGVADVQGKRWGVPRGFQELGTQVRGQANGTGNQIDG